MAGTLVVACTLVFVACTNGSATNDADAPTVTSRPAPVLPAGWPTILAFGPDAEIISVIDESDDTGHHQAVSARFDGIGQNVFATYRGALESVGYRIGVLPSAHDPRNLKWALRAEKDDHEVTVEVAGSLDGSVTGRITHDTIEPGSDR